MMKNSPLLEELRGKRMMDFISRIHVQREKPVILIVDDDPAILRLLDRFFSAEYITVTATNGREALEAMGTARPSLVITDISMPVMDGIRLVKEIRSRPEYAKIPVIILSAGGEVSAPEQGILKEAAEFLCKPIDVCLLARTVNRLLTRRGAHYGENR